MRKTAINRVKKHIIYFDYLRIFAICAVIVIHVAAQNWYGTNISSMEWDIFNVFDSVVRWAVPVFVMISGALFLSKEQPISKLYKKNILKILIILAIWTTINTVFKVLTTQGFTTIKAFMLDLATGPVHLWFLYMLIGLYMVVPFLQRIVADQKTMNYFLLLSLIFAFTIPKLIYIFSIFSPHIAEIITSKISLMRLDMVLGFTGYFVLGYKLSQMTLKSKTRIIIYLLGLFGAIFTIVATILLSNHDGSPNAVFYDNLSLNVAAMSVAVFVYAKYHVKQSQRSIKYHKTLSLFARCSLGVYLVHMMVLDSFSLIGLNTLSFNPLFSVPVISLSVIIVSYAISIIIYKIPKIGEWIV